MTGASWRSRKSAGCIAGTNGRRPDQPPNSLHQPESPIETASTQPIEASRRTQLTGRATDDGDNDDRRSVATSRKAPAPFDPAEPRTSFRSASLSPPSLTFDEMEFLVGTGLPDWVIQAQVGHVAPEMMKTYSHVRRRALDQAAAALEPTLPTPKLEAELVN